MAGKASSVTGGGCAALILELPDPEVVALHSAQTLERLASETQVMMKDIMNNRKPLDAAYGLHEFEWLNAFLKSTSFYFSTWAIIS